MEELVPDLAMLSSAEAKEYVLEVLDTSSIEHWLKELVSKYAPEDPHLVVSLKKPLKRALTTMVDELIDPPPIKFRRATFKALFTELVKRNIQAARPSQLPPPQDPQDPQEPKEPKSSQDPQTSDGTPASPPKLSFFGLLQKGLAKPPPPKPSLMERVKQRTGKAKTERQLGRSLIVRPGN